MLKGISKKDDLGKIYFEYIIEIDNIDQNYTINRKSIQFSIFYKQVYNTI